MLRLSIILVSAALALAADDTLGGRIAHTDPSSYRVGSAVHEGAGELHYSTLMPGSDFTTNFVFVHRGQMPAKGGIGAHFHNHMEEMYFILDGEAEFTINGRTSLIKGPAAVPCRMGSMHAIYNPTGATVQWMNIAVSTRKGKYDAFNTGDDRIGADLDEVPVFISTRFDKSRLRPTPNMYGGKGTVQYRRAFQPEVFYTNWSYLDHLVIPPGASVGKKRHPSVEEFYYVLNGAGAVEINGESASIKKDDGVRVELGDVHSFTNDGGADLELIILGTATEKWMLDTEDVD